ncbi:hypothetical protein [Pedobacter sp. P26]|uniref:hypothetical protein n=1 Tax=Pedobacter sp. P26 TaxID=3423956 RepID=UPI003D678940
MQVNTFYANLIKELLEIFPKLKEYKRKYFANDLEELNLLLSEVDEETILVIDGLDHIERIYRFSNMGEETPHVEIEILSAINE